MKHVFAITFISVFFYQGTHGNLVELLQNRVKEELTDLLAPVNDIMKNLNTTVEEIEKNKQLIDIQKKELMLKIHGARKECLTDQVQDGLLFFLNWDLDSCVEFSDKFKESGDLLFEGSELVMNMSMEFGSLLVNFTNCPTINPYAAYKCFKKNMERAKEDVQKYKKLTVPFVRLVAKTLHEMRVYFDKCVGIPYTDINQQLAFIDECSTLYQNENKDLNKLIDNKITHPSDSEKHDIDIENSEDGR